MVKVFEDEESDRWFQIISHIKENVTDATSAYELIERLVQNGSVKKDQIVMMVTVFAVVLEQLNELDPLTVESVANLVRLFIEDVFAAIVQPMMKFNKIKMFRSALDYELKLRWFRWYCIQRRGRNQRSTAGLD